MRVLWLVPALSLFLLLSGQVPLLSGQAYAVCCPCGMCRFGCTCGCVCGVNGTVVTPPSSEGTLNIAGFGDLKFTVPQQLKPVLIPKLGKGVQGKFSLRMVGIVDAKVGNLRDNAFDLRGLWDGDRRRELRADVMEERCSHCWTPCEAYPTILGNLARAAVSRSSKALQPAHAETV